MRYVLLSNRALQRETVYGGVKEWYVVDSSTGRIVTGPYSAADYKHAAIVRNNLNSAANVAAD